MKKQITIEKMSCNHCVQKITKQFETLPGITVIGADTTTKIVEVEDNAEHTLKDFQKVLEGTIYQATNMQ